MTYSEQRAADLLYHALHAEDPQQIIFLDFTAADIARICVNVVPICPRCDTPEWEGQECKVCETARYLLSLDAASSTEE